MKVEGGRGRRRDGVINGRWQIELEKEKEEEEEEDEALEARRGRWTKRCFRVQ